MKPHEPSMRYTSAKALLEFVSALFEHAGLSGANAFIVADNLVCANLRGNDTHGVFRAPTYLARVRERLSVANPEISVTKTAFAAALVDGGNGMGAVVGTRAMQEAITIAEKSGTALVSVRNSGHYGMAAYYVMQALERDMIAMAFTNSSPAFPPWGGRKPFFGTSPLAVAVPSGEAPPYVLDMAMSVLARGNVYIAAQSGASIPAGLALDSEGRPTTDPKALIDGGTMLPFGGVKGAGLSMLMDIFGGVLSGAEFGGRVGNPHMDFDRPQNVGHLFLCFRPDLFMPMSEFRNRMDELVARVKQQPLADGFDEILIPGEREARCARQRETAGIPLTSDVLERLEEEAAVAGVGRLETTSRPLTAT
ncbi:MAG: Ldh family oxidoreductase [Roseovarius sp.]|jgi:LDH2 family malate/lactate/ureidoglycolate dehydrogenase|uniref:Ldh family oxidoreductase n=1 Tax=Roseovarius sp. TaxID=1486281 RepID=UPI0032F00939